MEFVVNFEGLNEAELRKLESAMENDAFVAELAKQENANGVQAVLAANDINFTIEEVEKIRKTIAKAAATAGELTSKELDEVSGGGTFTLVSVTFGGKNWSCTINIPW